MIVWGGGSSSQSNIPDTSGRYNPLTRAWEEVSGVGAPSKRFLHSAVWTGDEMLVWGGVSGESSGAASGGGRYHPQENTWQPITEVNAPVPRAGHSAIWTGEQMIVWGGNASGGNRSDGGRYNPATDQGVSVASGASPRFFHTAVWTGTEMIVWGGFDQSQLPLNTGARYNPATNTWTDVSTTGAPPHRGSHLAIWDGSRMLIFGGRSTTTAQPPSGGWSYDPATDQWTSFYVPFAGYDASVVWTGTEAIAWGGWKDPYNFERESQNTGYAYNPTTGESRFVNISSASPRAHHQAVWTGAEMLVFGGRQWASSSFQSDSRVHHYNPENKLSIFELP
jgi:hypothetical protein